MSTVVKAHQKGFIRHYIRLQRIRYSPIFRRLVVGFLAFVALAVAFTFSLNDRIGEVVDLARTQVNSVYNKPENQIKGLLVSASTGLLRDQITALANYTFPSDVLSLDLKDLRQRIESIPAVKSAEVAAELGGHLRISVVERHPAVIFRNSSGLQLLDETGSTVMDARDRLAHMDLSLIAGNGAEKAVAEALEIFKAAAPIQSSVRGLGRVGERRWDLFLDGGRRVLLPQVEPVTAIERLLELDATTLLLQRQIAVIDLRDKQRTTIRLND